MPPIDVQAHFDFSNACTCNGCCTRCCSDTKPLYVNKHLQIEPWSKRKADASSLERTASRVDMLIRDKLPEVGVDKDIAHELVHSKMQLELGKRPITKRDLAAIIMAIQEVHSEVVSGD